MLLLCIYILVISLKLMLQSSFALCTDLHSADDHALAQVMPFTNIIYDCAIYAIVFTLGI